MIKILESKDVNDMDSGQDNKILIFERTRLSVSPCNACSSMGEGEKGQMGRPTLGQSGSCKATEVCM